MIKERLDRFFCVADCKMSSLLSNENLMASGIIPLGDILAQATVVAFVGMKKQDGASASTQPLCQHPKKCPRKRAHIIGSELDLPLDVEIEANPHLSNPEPLFSALAKSPDGERNVMKARGGQSKAASGPSFGDAESTSNFIEATRRKIAAKYSSMVDLVKNPGYLQSCIEA